VHLRAGYETIGHLDEIAEVLKGLQEDEQADARDCFARPLFGKTEFKEIGREVFVQFTSGRARIQRTVRGIGWTNQGAGSKVGV
jgi:hypothetical protein